MKDKALEYMEMFEDKGFFNDSITIKVDERVSETAVSNIENNTRLSKFDKTLNSLIYFTSATYGPMVITMGIICPFILGLAAWLDDETDYWWLIILTSLLITLVGTLMTYGEDIISAVYAAAHGMKYGSKLYTIDCNNNVIEVVVDSCSWRSDNVFMFDCQYGGNGLRSCLYNELFLDYSAAQEEARRIEAQRLNTITSILGDKEKAQKFMSSELYRICADDCFKSHARSFRTFVRNRDDFIRLCEWMKEKAEQCEKDKIEQAEKRAKENQLISDVMNL